MAEPSMDLSERIVSSDDYVRLKAIEQAALETEEGLSRCS